MEGFLHQVGETLRAEFSDLGSAAEITTVVVRLTVAVILGGLLGLERALRGKPAGMRTHMLVAVGAALFLLVPEQAGASDEDLSRIVQGLVAGIGFLGAGAILKHQGTEGVTGLTTAASIWLTAAIGMTAGMGRESTALLSTVLVLVVLMVPHAFGGGRRENSGSPPP